jgi:hypothetical protein
VDTTTSGPTTGLDAQGLLRDLQGLLKKVEEDLHRREQGDLGTAEALKGRYAEQTRRERTALKYADWRDDTLTQVAVAWVLYGVFVRYVEDNGWVDHPWLAGADTQEIRRSGPGQRGPTTRIFTHTRSTPTATTCSTSPARPARCRACTTCSTGAGTRSGRP